MYLINPKLCGKGGGTGRCVSGDHRDLPPAGAKRGDQRGGAGARGLGQRQGDAPIGQMKLGPVLSAHQPHGLTIPKGGDPLSCDLDHVAQLGRSLPRKGRRQRTGRGVVRRLGQAQRN